MIRWKQVPYTVRWTPGRERVKNLFSVLPSQYSWRFVSASARNKAGILAPRHAFTPSLIIFSPPEGCWSLWGLTYSFLTSLQSVDFSHSVFRPLWLWVSVDFFFHTTTTSTTASAYLRSIINFARATGECIINLFIFAVSVGKYWPVFPAQSGKITVCKNYHCSTRTSWKFECFIRSAIEIRHLFSLYVCRSRLWLSEL